MNLSWKLDSVVTDQRAWTAGTLDARKLWIYSLSEDCLSLLEGWIENWQHDPRPITENRVPRRQLIRGRDFLGPVLNALNRGRGFIVVNGISMEKYEVEQVRALYWAIGQLLGFPFEQDIKGTMSFEVRDYGQDVTQGARFSVTNAESSFHTDNSFGEQVPDFIGLLCLQAAKSGGRSQLMSAYALHNELLKLSPNALETLYQPYHFDRRGGIKEGEAPTLQNSILHWDGEELTCRYLRYYIEIGHQKAGEPLSCDQLKALETVETVLRRTDLRVEFELKPGQMLFTNNRWILHNRTAFEDYADPDLRRHYVRLWLKRKRLDEA